MEPTPEQKTEIRRLVEREGLTEAKATELATERQFDVIVGNDGNVVSPPPQPV